MISIQLIYHPLRAVQVRNSWGTSWGMKGYIRLEFGKNTCGITSFASYVSTNVLTLPPSAAPTSPQNLPQLTKSPSKTPTILPSPKQLLFESHESPKIRIPTSQRFRISASKSSRQKTSSTNYYYVDHYIPADLSGYAAPVAYYSSYVEQYYSPAPTGSNFQYRYYGSAEPTLTHYPTSIGNYGYYNSTPLPEPTILPLIYYGGFHDKHTKTPSPAPKVAPPT